MRWAWNNRSDQFLQNVDINKLGGRLGGSKGGICVEGGVEKFVVYLEVASSVVLL